MCLACEMAFFDMLAAMTPEAREKFLREQEAAGFACDAPPAPADVQPAEGERKP